jgi:hypothetical protein
MKQIHNHTLPFAYALIMLFVISAQSSPEGNPTWTEEPWNSMDLEYVEEKTSTLLAPIAFNISGNEPSTIRLGALESNYSEYAFHPFLSEIWIRKGEIWSQFEQVSYGENADLIIYMPNGGSADIYLVSYSKSTINHWSFKYQKGYHLQRLVPEDSGRLFIILSSENQPSNALILDVLPRPNEQLNSPVDVKTSLPGKTKVTIKSERFAGFEVYLDGVFYSSDTSDGIPDGINSFTFEGDKTHTITISERDGQGNIINRSEHTKSFKRDTAYTLLID